MKKSLVVGGALISMAAMVLSGCATGSGNVKSSSAGSGTEVNYLIGQPDTPEQLAAIKADLANFTKESGVKVNLQIVPNNSARTLIQTRLRSGEGPDVFQYDTGPGFAGVLAKAGLLYDLTDHVQQANWPVYQWARGAVTFDGKMYGIPDQIEEVGLFYNKTMFDQMGLKPPSTMAALDADATALKAAGKIPFAAGDKEGWEGGHLLSMALSSRVGSEAMQKYVTNQSDWNSAPVVDSLDTWSTFQKNGWLPPSPSAITYDNSNALFYSQKAGMDPTGTWLIQDFKTAAKFDVGFVPFPAPTGTGIPSTDLGGGIFMSASSQNVTASLKLMDYLVSEQHGSWEVNRYLIPAFPVKAQATDVSPLFQQVIVDTAQYAKGVQNNVGYNIDVNETDVFNKAMWDGVQGILAGSASPSSVASSLQNAAQQSAG